MWIFFKYKVILIIPESGGTSTWERADGRPFPPNVYERDGFLFLRGVTENDGGDYKCLRKNSRGSLIDVVVARIVVYGKLELCLCCQEFLYLCQCK